jgi:GrpB-like predicted nucleotidyltransferase (UPF0157 family)
MACSLMTNVTSSEETPSGTRSRDCVLNGVLERISVDARGLPPLNDPVEVVPYNPEWPAQFRLERGRILETLTPFTGPLLVEHIGSTGVPGLSAKPVLDIMAYVEKIPLSSEAIQALGTLGYEYRGDAGIPGREFFRTDPRDRHLHAVGFGDPSFASQMLFRSYLRFNPDAVRCYETLKLELSERFRDDRPAYTDAKGPLIQEILLEARGWEQDFGPLRWLQIALENAPFPWLIAGGWALELHAGSTHRPHEDVDVMVYRRDVLELQRFLLAQGWHLEQILNGRYAPWADEQPLGDGVHQVHAERDDNAAGYLDFLIAPGTEHDWPFRRDERITRSRSLAHNVGLHGLAYLAPEIVLLFKSKVAGHEPRGKDQLDFERIAPLLQAEPKAWLRAALELTSPDHAWFERL